MENLRNIDTFFIAAIIVLFIFVVINSVQIDGIKKAMVSNAATK